MAKIRRQARELEDLRAYAQQLEEENTALRSRVQELEAQQQTAKPAPAKKAAAPKTTGN